MSENPRAWTVLIYFAADNDLEGHAFRNKFDLEQLASNDRVHLLAQVDWHTQKKAQRFFFGGPGKSEEVELPNEPNTGGADALIEFVKFASDGDHRADNYLIVIWGHGNGIDDDEDDLGAAALRRARRKDSPADKAHVPESVAPTDETDFESAAAAPVALPELTFAGPRAKSFEGIGDDLGFDSAADSHPSDLTSVMFDGPDALTCAELKHAFNVIEKVVLKKKVAILGMDACLMSMAEIAQQISGSVDLMVASEEVIPGSSWPYGRILPALLEKPTMTPEELSALIVDRYVDRYQNEPRPVTLSVCRLSKAEELADALGDLGRALGTLVRDGELRKAITRARRQTQVFQFRDYVDLHHFCTVFQATLRSGRFEAARAKAEDACLKAESACERVMRVIEGEKDVPRSGFVVYAGNTSGRGGPLANARGVSIYFPPIPATYADLTLSASTRWDTFLHEYINAVFRPHALRAAALSAGGNGHDQKTDGGDITMSANATLPRSPRLLLPKGTTIKDATGGYEDELKSHAYLLLDEKSIIKVPKDTELDIPQKGKVKASTGTSLKATSGTRSVVPSVELLLPRCTLSRPLSGVTIELNDGTTVKAAGGEGGDPFVVLDDIEFKWLP